MAVTATEVESELGKRFWTEQETADVLHKSPRTLYRWHLNGVDLGRVKLGQQTLYAKAAVLEFLERLATSASRRGRGHR
jgi:hypothetical protein